MGFTVDRNRCVGSAYCQRIAPDVFDIDDTGLAFIVTAEPSGDPLAAARRAVGECPSMSIREHNATDSATDDGAADAVRDDGGARLA